jgi:hypothetical protein
MPPVLEKEIKRNRGQGTVLRFIKPWSVPYFFAPRCFFLFFFLHPEYSPPCTKKRYFITE